MRVGNSNNAQIQDQHAQAQQQLQAQREQAKQTAEAQNRVQEAAKITGLGQNLNITA